MFIPTKMTAQPCEEFCDNYLNWDCDGQNDAGFTYCVYGCSVKFWSCVEDLPPGQEHQWTHSVPFTTMGQPPNTPSPSGSYQLSPPQATQVTVQHCITDPLMTPPEIVCHTETFTVGGALNLDFQIIDETQTCDEYCVTLQSDPNVGCWVQHVWSVDGLPAQAGLGLSQPTICFDQEGTFTIEHNFLDACNYAPGSLEIDAEFTQPLSPLDPGFVFSIPDPGCPPVDIPFTSNPNHPMNTHEWFIDGIFASSEPNPVLNFPNPGTFQITHTVTEPVCEEEVTETQTIVLLPAADLNVTTTLAGNVCAGGVTVLNYDICLSGAGSGSFDIDLTLDLPPGVTIAPLGNFFPDGEETVSVPINGSCPQLTLILDLDAGLESGDLLNIVLNAESADLCLEESVFSETLTVETEPTAGFTWVNDGCTPEVIFTSTAQNGDNFSWDFGDSNTGTNNPETHTYADFGDYTVTHTVSNECGSDAVSETVSIMEIPLTADFTFEEFTCMLVNFESEYEFGTHLWNFGDGGTSMEVNPVYGFVTAGPHTVTHTVTHPDCGTVTTTMQITLDDSCLDNFECPCLEPGSFNIGAPGTETSLEQIGLFGNITANCIAIAGTLSADADSWIFFSEMRMQPASNIIIRGGNFLNIGLTDIHGCAQMWQGITVESGGSFIAVDNTIADARYAVQLFNSSLIAQGNTFDKNYIGIYTDEAIGFPGFNIISGNPIVNNTFISTAPLLPAPPQWGFNPGSKTFAGVQLKSTIGLTVGNGNLFDGIINGVIAEGGVITIDNSTFVRIEEDILLEGPQATDNCSVFLDGSVGIIINNTFEDCRTGIRARASNLFDVSGNDIGLNIVDGELSHGISLDLCFGRAINITENTFTVGKHGIFAQHINNSNGFNISYNDPITLIDPGIGISLGDVHFANEDIIEWNLIHITYQGLQVGNGGMGIRVTDCSNGSFSNNIINNDHPGGGHSSFFSNTDFAKIKYNTVNYSGDALFSQTALHGLMDLEDSENCEVSCNIYNCDETGQALEFTGTCSNTFLWGNTFNWLNIPQPPLSNFIGLRLTDAIISPQPFMLFDDRHGNMWDSEDKNGADYIGNPFFAVNSKFIVHEEIQPFHPVGVSGPVDWFEVFEGDFLDCDPMLNQPDDRNDLVTYETIAEGKLSEFDYGEGRQWTADRKLFARLTMNNDLVTPGILEDFYNGNLNSTLGQFYGIDEGIRQMFELSESDRTALSESLVSIKTITEEILSLEAQLPDASGSELTSLLEQLVDLKNDLSQLVNTANEIYDANQQTRTTSASQYISDNDGISVNTTPEINRKLVNDIHGCKRTK